MKQYSYYNDPPTHKIRNALLYISGVLVLLLSIGLIVGFSSQNRCVMKRQVVTIKDLPTDLENFSILHISDLNGREMGENQSTIKKLIGNKTFSCVVMTGDMVGEKGDYAPLVDLVKIFPSETPVLIIPGDSDPPMVDINAHDSLSTYSTWALKLHDAGAYVLDLPMEIKKGKASIWFIPEELYTLDMSGTAMAFQKQAEDFDARIAAGQVLTPDESAKRRYAIYQVERMKALEEIEKKITDKDVQVCLSHVPLTAEYVSTMYQWISKDTVFSLHGASLILSGHRAGGSWRLPSFIADRAIYVEGSGFFPDDEYIKGLHYVSGIPQYISSGIGTAKEFPLPGRLNNPPEITQIVLTADYRE